MFCYEIIGDYNHIVGVAILDDDNYQCFLFDHPESNSSIENVVGKLLSAQEKYTYDLKFTTYCSNRFFGVEFPNTRDLISILVTYGKIDQKDEVSQVNRILRTRKYKSFGYKIVPGSILSDYYCDRLVNLRENIEDIDPERKTSEHFFRVSKCIGEIESTGLGVDVKYAREFDGDSKYKKYFRYLSSVTYPRFSIGSTVTGRLSSGADTKFNFMAIPKEFVRRAIVPRNDFLIEFDYKSFEVNVMLSMFAYNETKLLFENNDIYTALGNEIDIEDRDLLKRVVFQRLYGRSKSMSNIKIALMLKEYNKQDIGVKLIDKYFGWIDEPVNKLYNKASRTGFLKTEFGRHVIFNKEDLQRRNLPFQNYVQATAADIAFKSLCSTVDYLKDMKSKVILYCHDSIVVDAREDERLYVLKIKDIMRNIYGDYKLPVSVSVGKNYGNMVGVF